MKATFTQNNSSYLYTHIYLTGPLSEGFSAHIVSSMAQDDCAFLAYVSAVFWIFLMYFLSPYWHWESSSNTDFLNVLTKASEEFDSVTAKLLDMIRAFDRVPHGILLAEPDTHGIADPTVAWLSSYPTSRLQIFHVNGIISNLSGNQWSHPKACHWFCTFPYAWQWHDTSSSMLLHSCLWVIHGVYISFTFLSPHNHWQQHCSLFTLVAQTGL